MALEDVTNNEIVSAKKAATKAKKSVDDESQEGITGKFKDVILSYSWQRIIH